MNPEKKKENNATQESYLGQDVYIPASNWLIVVSLIMALILNFIPLQRDFLLLRPDFAALAIAYWNIHHPQKMGMGIAFMMGLMMDVSNAGVLGQHALAYSVTVYLTSVFGRRLRLFNPLQQAPQVGLVLLIMQTIIVLIALSNGSAPPDWSYFLATATGILIWVPTSWILTQLQKPKPDPDAL